MGLLYFIYLIKLLSLAFIRLNGAKRRDIITRHRDGICETNCSQECRQQLIPGEEYRLWSIELWNLIGSPTLLCNTQRCWIDLARVAASYLLSRPEVLLPRSTRCYSLHEHYPGALFGPSGLVFVIPLLQYILLCDTVTPDHWFKPCGIR
jgi:hypothetical protein